MCMDRRPVIVDDAAPLPTIAAAIDMSGACTPAAAPTRNRETTTMVEFRASAYIRLPALLSSSAPVARSRGGLVSYLQGAQDMLNPQRARACAYNEARVTRKAGVTAKMDDQLRASMREDSGIRTTS